MTTRFDYYLVWHQKVDRGTAQVGSGPVTTLGTYRPARTFALALAPTDIEYTPHAPTSVALTQGGVAIQRARQRRWDLSLSGEFGLRYKIGFDRDGFPITTSGPELHRELFEFLLSFWRASSKGQDVRMSWHDLQADRHLWVEPMNPRDIMDGTTQVYARWSLTFLAYQQASAPEEGLGAALAFFANMREKYRNAQRWAERVAGAVDLVRVAIDTTVDFTRQAEEAFDFVPKIVDAAASIGESALNVVHYPAAFWRRMVDEVQTAVYRAEHLARQFDAVESDYEAMFGLTGAAMQLERDVEAMAFALETGDEASSTENGVYVVSAGETLDVIALQVYGDSAVADDIAALNGLQPPYISLTGIPGTAGPGDVLLLPPGAINPPAFPEASAAVDALLYGVDFALETQGQWAGDFATSGSDPDDIDLISGVPLVVQDLNLRVNTTAGEDPDNPADGLPVQIGAPIYNEAALLLALTREQLLRDDRLVSVQGMDVALTGLSVDVQATGVLRSGRAIALQSTTGVGE